MAALKDEINASAAATLAGALRSADPAFDADAFVRDACDGLEPLELKARIAHVADALSRALPEDPEAACALLTRAAAPQEAGQMWVWWPAMDWIALALRPHPELAWPLMAALTRLASAEFCIRPFIDDDPAAAREHLDGFARSGDRHVRRLASEGTRPLLPWAPRCATVTADPAWPLWLLDALREDASEDVRRSVANHLNDLGRVAPALALETAARWHAEGGAHVDAVLRHGLRGLVKAGDRTALGLLGRDVDADVRVEALEVRTPEVVFGDALSFAFDLVSHEEAPASVTVDYAIGFARARGGVGRKVFKLATVQLAPGERRTIERRHAIRPITTRRHHPGRHELDVQVNGRIAAAASFVLVLPDPA